MSNLAVLYIGGIEHNGSTFLGVTLGNHPQVRCGGELSQLPRLGWLGDEGYLCACGSNILKCDFWSEVLYELECSIGKNNLDVFFELEEKIDRNLCLPRVIAERFLHSELFDVYAVYNYALFEAIHKVGGESIIIDTSKRAARALALSKIEGIDLRFVHLLRDARGVAFSSFKTGRAIRRSYWEAAARWNLINLGSWYVQKSLGSERAICIRYEDFISGPSQTLREIGTLVDVDMTAIAELMANEEKMSIGHLGVGNALRLGNGIRLRTDIQWPEVMPKGAQDRVWKMTSILMRYCGYER